MIVGMIAVVSTAVAAPMNRTQWLVDNLENNYKALLTARSNAGPRDLSNGALAALLLHDDCSTAVKLLRRFGSHYDMSFGGEAIPAIFNLYHQSCFASHPADDAFFIAAINASLPQTRQEATSQDISYSNMVLMAIVEAFLFGELAETIPLGSRATTAKLVGYSMWTEFLEYTRTAGIHEMVSPTYTNVQFSALYLGYIFTSNATLRDEIESVLDYIWAEVAANYFEPAAALTGAHSRDYDTLLSHGMTHVDMYAVGHFRGMRPLRCERSDPHCEGAPSAWNASVGTGEPMTCLALTLLNIVHPKGYRVKPEAIALSTMRERVVRSRFLGQTVTANGQFGVYGDTYNYIRVDRDNASGFAIGSASQEWIVRTHSKYEPYPGSKLVNIVLGPTFATGDNDSDRPVPSVSIQTDAFDSPYGIWRDYPEWSHTDKGTHLSSHPGNVQNKNVLLATTAIDSFDKLDAFSSAPGASSSGSFLDLATNILLPLLADEYFVRFPNGTFWSRVFSRGERAFELPLHAGAVVALRVRTAGLALRVFECDGAGGHNASLSLLGDSKGMPLGAIRIVCRHFKTRPGVPPVVLNAPHVRFGALMVVDTVDTDGGLMALAEATARSKIVSHVSSSNVWEAALVDVATGNEKLSVFRNLTCSEQGAVRYNQTIHTTWNCLLERRINGNRIVPTTLEVNGHVLPSP